jgi:CRP/FNR family transcriptional regulator
VKFNYENEFEKNLILTIVDSPRLLGGINVFNDELNMFSITAIDECEACLIDINVLKNLALKNSALALRLMEFTTSMFRDSILNFISLAHKQVSGRVADILIYLSEKIYKSNKFILTLTRKELSEFAGCSQENIINTLTRFHKDGIICSNVKIIEILDMTRLAEISRFG